MNPKTILIAGAAGAAAALLFAGLVLQSASALSLALAAPIPIAIASLGWGSLAGFIAAAVATLIVGVLAGTPLSAATILLSMALPTAIAGHLAGLARPRETLETAPTFPRPIAEPLPRAPQPAAPALDWYPLERVLFALTLCAAFACLILGWLIGYDPAEIGTAVGEALTQGDAGLSAATNAQIAEVSALVVRLIPFVQPAVLVLTLVVGLYLGAFVTRLSGRLPRPRDDIPAAAALPRVSLGLFALAILGSFLPGAAGLAASVFAGAFICAFALVGLATMHRRTRGRAGRGLILFTAYAAILLLSFPLVLFAMLGVYETGRGRPAAVGGPPSNDQ
ncbi:hypothetical protein [Aurantimonas sp. Leaf443]|uniref:hypothetical protein n=1 Tax=Aurantimonas sp. Leaf443 TaxID=1736378 RepID=UPI0006FF2DB2|nr:hypothetical protein [Aurantimonas sp. Leaf443]KQT88390.1 hypothetical protein ASG48_02920 [Aurantimonas sp. Leaf443]